MEPLEGDYFCSKSCGSFTQQLAAQLVNPMERIKPSAMQKALAKPSHNAKRQGVAAQGGGVATMKAVIEVSLSGCINPHGQVLLYPRFFHNCWQWLSCRVQMVSDMHSQRLQPRLLPCV